MTNMTVCACTHSTRLTWSMLSMYPLKTFPNPPSPTEQEGLKLSVATASSWYVKTLRLFFLLLLPATTLIDHSTKMISVWVCVTKITNLKFFYCINVKPIFHDMFFQKEIVLLWLSDVLLLPDVLSTWEICFFDPQHEKRFVFFPLLILICKTLLLEFPCWRQDLLEFHHKKAYLDPENC